MYSSLSAHFNNIWEAMAEEKFIGDGRDWTGLLDELLHLISEKLPDLHDFIRFRTVCKSWCSSAPLSDPPQQLLPWLLDRSNRERYEVGLGSMNSSLSAEFNYIWEVMAEEMSDIGDGRDWTELPENLFYLIYKKLPDLLDFIRFRAVCKSWRSSAPLSDPPQQQLPWLLDCWYVDISDEAAVLTAKQNFYSLSSGEVGSINIEPHYRGKTFAGPCRDYLLLRYEQGRYYHEQCFALFNPLTNSYIRLAHVPQGFVSHPQGIFEPYCPVWTNGNDPISKRRIVVFFITTDRCEGWLAIHNPHNKEWVMMLPSTFDYYCTCCYMKGMFFTTSLYGDTHIFCEKTTELLHEFPPPDDEVYLEPETVHLIACSEVILRVCWIQRNFQDVNSCKFLLYRLYFHVGNGHHKWVQICDIGDKMIFLDTMNGFSIRARPTDGFKGNCIYFLYPRKHGRPYRYDIATDMIERVPCPFKECTWFFPGLH